MYRFNRQAMKSREEIQSLRVPGNSREPADCPPASCGNRGDGGLSHGRGHGCICGCGRGYGHGD